MRVSRRAMWLLAMAGTLIATTEAGPAPSSPAVNYLAASTEGIPEYHGVVEAPKDYSTTQGSDYEGEEKHSDYTGPTATETHTTHAGYGGKQVAGAYVAPAYAQVEQQNFYENHEESVYDSEEKEDYAKEETNDYEKTQYAEIHASKYDPCLAEGGYGDDYEGPNEKGGYRRKLRGFSRRLMCGAAAISPIWEAWATIFLVIWVLCGCCGYWCFLRAMRRASAAKVLLKKFDELEHAINNAKTRLTKAAKAGDDRLHVPAGRHGFTVGDLISIAPGSSTSETHEVKGFGSIILNRPLKHAHPAGTLVVIMNAPSSGARHPDLGSDSDDSDFESSPSSTRKTPWYRPGDLSPLSGLNKFVKNVKQRDSERRIAVDRQRQADRQGGFGEGKGDRFGRDNVVPDLHDTTYVDNSGLNNLAANDDMTLKVGPNEEWGATLNNDEPNWAQQTMSANK